MYLGVGFYRQGPTADMHGLYSISETQGPGHRTLLHNAPGGWSFDEADARCEAKV